MKQYTHTVHTKQKQTLNHVRDNKRTPFVSVIMPVYNAEQYIADAVTSILRQTYNNFEFIIVDDASTDGTSSLLESFAKQDSRIILVTNKKKGYLAGSLNKALKLAKGTYIARMDADDISLPQRLEKQVAFLEKHKDIVAVGCQEDIINEYNEIVADKYFPASPRECRNMIMNFMVIQPPTLMARASVMKKLTYDTGIAKHDDIDMHFQLLKHGEFANIPDIAFQYRVTNTSYTHNKIKSVYFMALRIRMRAIRYYGYRPTLGRLGMFLAETAVVAVLPPHLIMSLFEFIRYTKRIPWKMIPRKAYNFLFTL